VFKIKFNFRQLHWIPVAPRIEYKLCILVHKALIGQAPDYITNLLTPVTNATATSSNQEPSGELVTMHSVIAPRVWNH